AGTGWSLMGAPRRGVRTIVGLVRTRPRGVGGGPGDACPTLRFVRTVLVVLLVVATAAVAACDDDRDEPLPLLPTAEIRVEGDGVSETLTVELARTSRQHQQGLMYRQELPEDRGMLFLFESEQNGGFWM